jgi:carboxypeptidase D
MHGDETIGREILINLIYHLLSSYGKDTRLTQLVDTTNIFIMPTANPDGFESVQEGSCITSHGRNNANNVDLNRNFPDQFDSDQDREHQFKGREPETVSLMNWIRENRFVLSANLHAGSVVASYPYDDSRKHQSEGFYAVSPDDQVFRHLALTYSKSHGNMHLGNHCGDKFTDGITNGAQWYDVPGGMQDFNYLASNCFEITVELTCCKYPTRDKIREEWTLNREALISYIQQVHMGVKGFVHDNVTGKAIGNAVISVEGIAHDITTSPLHGDYWGLLVPGVYTLRATKNGYLSQC